jgi:hypothetical protein
MHAAGWRLLSTNKAAFVGKRLGNKYSTQYRSSRLTKAKQQRRTSQVNKKFNGDIDRVESSRVIQSNASVFRWIDDRSLEIQKKGRAAAVPPTFPSRHSLLAEPTRTRISWKPSYQEERLYCMLDQFQEAT